MLLLRRQTGWVSQETFLASLWKMLLCPYNHLWQPGDQCKGEHPSIVLPVRGEVGRVAEAVGSYGQDDDAQELQ